MKFGIMWFYSRLKELDTDPWDFTEFFFSERMLSLPIERIKSDLIIHAPFRNSNLGARGGERDKAVNNIKKAIDITDQMGSNTLIFHMGIRRGDKSLERALNSIIELKEYADDKNIKLVGENMDNNPKIDLLGSKIKDIDRMLEEVDLCFDVGHAHTTDNIQEILNNYKDRIRHIHLSDNNGLRDQHLKIGEGNINFKPLIEEFKDEEVTASFELFDVEKSLESRKRIKGVMG